MADKPVIERLDDGKLYFDCPGCGFMHAVAVGEGDGPRWTWNGDFVNPTFSPSIRVRWDHGEQQEPRCCHSFVRNGNIEFCSDSTHSLAGQTVPLPEVEN